MNFIVPCHIWEANCFAICPRNLIYNNWIYSPEVIQTANDLSGCMEKTQSTNDQLLQLVYNFNGIILQKIFSWLRESFSKFLSGLYNLVARIVSRLTSGKYRTKTYKRKQVYEFVLSIVQNIILCLLRAESTVNIITEQPANPDTMNKIPTQLLGIQKFKDIP